MMTVSLMNLMVRKFQRYNHNSPRRQAENVGTYNALNVARNEKGDTKTNGKQPYITRYKSTMQRGNILSLPRGKTAYKRGKRANTTEDSNT